MAKLILLLFAVFAVLQVQAAPGLYDRFFQDEELKDLLDEPRMSERRFDDSYSSPLARRGGCLDFNALACGRASFMCKASPGQFGSYGNYRSFKTLCCLTCQRFLKK